MSATLQKIAPLLSISLVKAAVRSFCLIKRCSAETPTPVKEF